MKKVEKHGREENYPGYGTEGKGNMVGPYNEEKQHLWDAIKNRLHNEK